MKKLFLSITMLTLLVSISFSQTWTQQTSPTTSNLFAGWCVNYDVCWLAGVGGVVVRTSNSGTTWTNVGGGLLAGADLYSISCIDANTAIVGAGDGSIYRTSNAGANWTFINLTPANPFIDVVHMFNATYGFVMGDPAGGTWKYYITSNGGLNWTQPSNAPPSVGTEAGWNNSYGATDTGHIWWGTNVSKIWRGGFRSAFTSSSTGSQVNSYGVCFNDNTTGVATFSTGPTQVSGNGGATWTAGGFTPATAHAGLRGVMGTTYMWFSTQGQIYRSINNGGTWALQYTLPATSAGYGLTMWSINRGWCGTQGGKIFRYDSPEGIAPIGGEVPNSYALGQNYPNPFNPTSTINFSIPKSSHVTIKVYDALGNEVLVVANEFRNAGNYSAGVDASNLASGIYYYTLSAGDFRQTKKMSLVK